VTPPRVVGRASGLGVATRARVETRHSNAPLAMADARDIMGVARIEREDEETRKAKKPHKTRVSAPKGVSREVWQITGGGETRAGDARVALAPTAIALHGLKDKRKITARTVTWSWVPFRNSARADGLQLKHWVKRAVGAGQPALLGTNGGDVGGDYAFAKYNKKVDMIVYTNEEYEQRLKHLDESWSKEETDYLFEQLARFDLRFIIAHDRWAFAGSKARSVDDLKVRYYSIAKTLIEARAETPEAALAHQVVKMPFNAQHEYDRKVALNTLLNRTNGEMKEEAEILNKVKEIEKRRRAENQALLQRAAAVFAQGRMQTVERPLSIDEVRADFETLAPELPTKGNAPLKPGAYLRGAHFVAVANEQAIQAQGGARFGKRIDQALEDLGVSTPVMNTHAVCAGWLKLREETIELLRARKELVAVYERLVAKGKTPGYIPGMADIEAKKSSDAPLKSESALPTPAPTPAPTAMAIKQEVPAPAPATLKRKAEGAHGRKAQRPKRG